MTSDSAGTVTLHRPCPVRWRNAFVAVTALLTAGCAWQPLDHVAPRLSVVTHADEQVRIRVKSFIAPIASPGYRPHREIDPATANRLGFNGSWLTQNAAREFMHAADEMFSEAPALSNRQRHDYRLHSAKDLRVHCDGDTLVNIDHTPLAIDVGFDAGLRGTGRVVFDVVRQHQGRAQLVMHMRGQPPEEAEPAFELVSPRDCRSIWHRVEAAITCHAGQAVVAIRARGSAFPSHRVWVNDRMVGTIGQGPMESLWRCDDHDRTLIR